MLITIFEGGRIIYKSLPVGNLYQNIEIAFDKKKGIYECSFHVKYDTITQKIKKWI